MTKPCLIIICWGSETQECLQTESTENMPWWPHAHKPFNGVDSSNHRHAWQSSAVFVCQMKYLNIATVLKQPFRVFFTMGKEKRADTSHRSDYSRVKQKLPEYSQFKPESNAMFVQPRKKDIQKERRKERKTERSKETNKVQLLATYETEGFLPRTPRR